MKNIITVKDFETWSTVESMGTYEGGSPDNEIWSFNGKMYRLCFAELPMTEREMVLEEGLR